MTRSTTKSFSHASVSFTDPTEALHAVRSTGKAAVAPSSRVGSPAVDDYQAYRSSSDGVFLANQHVARSLRNLQPTAKVLMSCHTPHFLGKADTTAPDRHPDDETLSFEAKGSLLVQSLNMLLLIIHFGRNCSG